MEETGCTIKVGSEVGEIIEFRSKFNLLQTSYCYLGEIISKGQTAFTEKELNDGFELLWLTLDEAIETLENDQPDDYEGPFIQKRDLMFLKKAKEIISKN